MIFEFNRFRKSKIQTSSFALLSFLFAGVVNAQEQHARSNATNVPYPKGVFAVPSGNSVDEVRNNYRENYQKYYMPYLSTASVGGLNVTREFNAYSFNRAQDYQLCYASPSIDYYEPLLWTGVGKPGTGGYYGERPVDYTTDYVKYYFDRPVNAIDLALKGVGNGANTYESVNVVLYDKQGNPVDPSTYQVEFSHSCSASSTIEVFNDPNNEKRIKMAVKQAEYSQNLGVHNTPYDNFTLRIVSETNVFTAAKITSSGDDSAHVYSSGSSGGTLVNLYASTIQPTCTGADSDGDGIPDMCDDDIDNDGLTNEQECNSSNILKNSTFTGLTAEQKSSNISEWNLTGSIWKGADYVEFSEDDTTMTLSQDIATLATSFNPTIGITMRTRDYKTGSGNTKSTMGVYYAGVLYALVSTNDREGANVVEPRNGAKVSSTSISNYVFDFNGTPVIPPFDKLEITLPYAVPANGKLELKFNLKKDDFQIESVELESCQDIDGDGKPNFNDPDSDGDGCSDSKEAYGRATPVDTNGRITGGVDSHGVPTYANGKTPNLSDYLDASTHPACDVCAKDNINPAGTALPTKVGVSLFNRNTEDSWIQSMKGGHIGIEANTKGFVITRATTTQIEAIASPQQGMIVYDTTAKCLKVYTKSGWKCFTTQTCAK